MIGLGFVFLALLVMLGVGYFALLDRHRGIAMLDRRIVAIAAPAVVARRRRQLRIPDFVAPVLARAQIEPTPRMALITVGTLALIFLATLAIAGTAAALIAAVVPVAAIVVYVRWRATRRIDILLESMPFYLDGVRQLLMVGGSLSQALVRALPSASIELQGFMRPAARRIELGAPVVDSMQMVADRLHVAEVSMLVAAIRANLRFGGPMTAVLGNLAQISRERLRIQRELRSATSEVKVSTRLLMALPIGMVGFLFFSNRAYVDFFLHEHRGHWLGMLAIVLQVLGMLVMRWLMRMPF